MDTPLYLRVRGRVLGPYDQEKLRALVRRGQLSRMHEVSTDGTHWVRASTYAELFVGTPVKLVVPEMQVAAAPPVHTLVEESVIQLADDTLLADNAPTPASVATAPIAVAPPAERKWYYEFRGGQHGPVEESALRQMLDTGQLDVDALVWNDSMTQWAAASQVPGLVAAPVVHRTQQGAVEHGHAPGQDLEGLCKAAQASRPWVLFLSITAFVYAGLCLLGGFLELVIGADKGITFLVASGLFGIVAGAVVATGGFLLSSYAGRLGALVHSKSARVLESAMDRLRTFWVFVSIVLIVALTFIGFVAIWAFAAGVANR